MSNIELHTEQSLFVIRDTQGRGGLVVFGKKGAWVTKGAAKAAFVMHAGKKAGDFDRQGRYVVEEIN